MKDEYPDVKQDLYGAFVVRGIELADRRGLLAIVIGDTWMSIKSFEALRLRLLSGHAFGSFVHMRDVSNHPDIFGANAAFVLSMAGDRSRHAPYIRVTPLGTDRKEEDLRAALAERTKDAGYHLASGEDFAAIPGSPIVYWLSEKMRAAFSLGDPLREVAEPRVGLQTSNVDRFVRCWSEVSSSALMSGCPSREDGVRSGAKWFPYNNGGDFRKWYGNQEEVVNWGRDGADVRAFGAEDGGRPRSRPQNVDVYFREAVAWTAVSSGVPGFRYFPRGFIPSNAGMACYADPTRLVDLIGFANSLVAEHLLSAMAPTLNLGVGEIGRLPVISSRDPSRHRDVVRGLISGARNDWDCCEISWGFEGSPLVALARLEAAPGEAHQPRSNSVTSGLRSNAHEVS